MILVDDQDAWILEAVTWHIQKVPRSDLRYVMHTARIDGQNRIFALHRLIAQAPPGSMVDFKNGNGMDCRRDNLRICTHAQNMRNRARAKSNKLGVKGVYPKGKKFVAEIKADRIKHRLGTFEVLEDAAEAYKEAARFYHGEFARPE